MNANVTGSIRQMIAVAAVLGLIALGASAILRSSLPANSAGGGIFALASDGIVSAARSIKGDLPGLAFLDSRSPGERVKGALTKIKRERAQPRLAVRRQEQPAHSRALPRIARPLASVDKPADQATVPAVLDGKTYSAPAALAGAPELAVLVPAPGIIASGGGGGGGGSGGTPGAITPPTTTVPSVTSAVPEPSTWAMMLMGFAFVGLSARSRRPGSRRLAS